MRGGGGGGGGGGGEGDITGSPPKAYYSSPVSAEYSCLLPKSLTGYII